MDWVSATYNRFESLAMAADRALGIMVERCEDWLAGRSVKAVQPADGPEAGAGKTAGGQPISA